MSNGITIIGFSEFNKKLNQLPVKTRQFGNAAVLDAAKEWAELAKRSAPVDQRKIRQGIVDGKIADLTAEVTSASGHSRFVEFGTKRKKRVPADLASYEASIPYAKTGDYYDFLNSILDWAKRKGIGVTYSVSTRKKDRVTKDAFLATAQAIANSIMRNGINPQPFFFKHREPVFKKLNDKVQKYLNTPQ